MSKIKKWSVRPVWSLADSFCHSQKNAGLKGLNECEEYAQSYAVLFKTAKSKCVICESPSQAKALGFNRNVQFTMNSYAIDNVGS